MVKRRKPGAGRKPNPNKKVMFSTRLEPDVMAALKAAAQTWPGGNVSTFTERLITDGLRERDEAARDRALRALNFMIGQLAERASGEFYIPVEKRSKSQPWRTNLFRFRAFKLLVKKLLDALQEPAGEIGPLHSEEETRAAMGEWGLSPEDAERFAREMIENTKTPEAFASEEFANFWLLTTRKTPLNEAEREIFQSPIGESALREHYSLPRARADLDLPKS